MTTICTDGKSIAADSQRLNSSGTASKVTKIWKLKDGTIFGVAGNLQDGVMAKEWFEAGCPKEKPKLDDNFAGIICKGGKVYKIESGLVKWEVQVPVAIGTGRDFALMAMYLGVTPAIAIETIIFLKMDVGTGGDIQSFSLENNDVK